MDHLVERGQEALNHGLVELEQLADAVMPLTNFNIRAVTQDTLMCVYDDTNDDGSEVNRDGLWIDIDITRALWRSAVIILAGPKASPELKAGVRIAFPNDKGIKSVRLDASGKKQHIVFINEDRIFGILDPKTT